MMDKKGIRAIDGGNVTNEDYFLLYFEEMLSNYELLHN